MSEQDYLAARADREVERVAKAYIPKRAASRAFGAGLEDSAKRGTSAFRSGYAQARQNPGEGFGGVVGVMPSARMRGAATAGGYVGAYRNPLIAGGAGTAGVGALGVGANRRKKGRMRRLGQSD